MYWLQGFAIFVGALAVGYLPSILLKQRYGSAFPDPTIKLASDVVVRIGALHGLIMALVFAGAQSEYQTLKSNIENEAGAITHIYFDSVLLGNADLQSASTRYLDAVLHDDWPQLAQGNELSDSGWKAWRDMLNASLAIEPQQRRQTELASRIQANIWRIEDLRQQRGFVAIDKLPTAF